MTYLPKNKNLWKTLSTEEGFESPWIKLIKSVVINPVGGEQTYSHVHFKNKAIGIVPYEDGNVWLIGQSRFATDRYSWEIPEGGCPHAEDPLNCARRELLEETGLIAQTLTPLMDYQLSNSATDEVGRAYLATGLTQGAQELEECEDITVKKVSLETLYAAVETGEITDVITVAVTYKLMLMRAQGKL